MDMCFSRPSEGSSSAQVGNFWAYCYSVKLADL